MTDNTTMRMHLEALAGAIYEREWRQIHDSHDFSSSSYSGFDDGHNMGIQDGMDELINAFLETYRHCPECGHQDAHAEDDFICVRCREKFNVSS